MKKASFNLFNCVLWSLYPRYLLCMFTMDLSFCATGRASKNPFFLVRFLSVLATMVSHLCTCSLPPVSVPQPAVCCGPTCLLCLQAENVFAGMGVLEASELPRRSIFRCWLMFVVGQAATRDLWTMGSCAGLHAVLLKRFAPQVPAVPATVRKKRQLPDASSRGFLLCNVLSLALALQSQLPCEPHDPVN
jgi:hypothetical protein